MAGIFFEYLQFTVLPNVGDENSSLGLNGW
jgi:hypothetical protein